VLVTKKPEELTELIDDYRDKFLSAIQGVSVEIIDLTKDFNQILHENDYLYN